MTDLKDLAAAAEAAARRHRPVPLEQLARRARTRRVRRASGSLMVVVALVTGGLVAGGALQTGPGSTAAPVGAPGDPLPPPDVAVSVPAFPGDAAPTGAARVVAADPAREAVLALYEGADERWCFALVVRDENNGGSCSGERPSVHLPTVGGGTGTWLWGTLPDSTATVRVTTRDGQATVVRAFDGGRPDEPNFFLVDLQREPYQATVEALDSDGRLLERVEPGDQD